MNISDFRKLEENHNQKKLTDLLKLAKTLQFKKKVDESFRVAESFLDVVKNPVVSCGGGKDGTAIALIFKKIDPKIKILTAQPPNPLPDRNEHLKNLKSWLGDKNWIELDYDWDVDAVLAGKEKYPEGLKMKKMSQWAKDEEVDGVIFGVRAAESRARTINYRKNGKIYKMKDGWRCQPIVDWSAEESICFTLLLGAPINPVYEKMGGIGNLEQLRDGTWWPHGVADRGGWMKKYYPDFYDLYRKAETISILPAKECSY